MSQPGGQSRRKAPTRPRFGSARALVAACVAARCGQGNALVDCSGSPDCAALRRQPCSIRGEISNTCGACLPGTWGGKGPMNTVCLSQTACGAIYPGEETCTIGSPPFLMPLGRCVCDDGTGALWPSAPGLCGQVFIKYPNGIGIYEVQQCTSRTCDEATCTIMASWWPNVSQTVENVSFPCVSEGSDAIQLVDNCDVITDQLSPSALCGHVGFVATSTIWTALGETPVDCELSPSCPETVLDTTRPAQSCCFGTHWSLRLDDQGEETNVTAPGFCPMVHSLEANVSSNASNSSNSSSFECIVTSSGRGWTGCACLDSRGYTQAGWTCTATCDRPWCNLPAEGIQPVPSAWLSSEVAASLLVDQGSHGRVASFASRTRWWMRLLLLQLLKTMFGA